MSTRIIPIFIDGDPISAMMKSMRDRGRERVVALELSFSARVSLELIEAHDVILDDACETRDEVHDVVNERVDQCVARLTLEGRRSNRARIDVMAQGCEREGLRVATEVTKRWLQNFLMEFGDMDEMGKPYPTFLVDAWKDRLESSLSRTMA